MDTGKTGLSDEIAACRELFRRLKLRPSHYLEDQALVRYLQRAIALAEVLNLALRPGHVAGTEPVVRALFEVYVDLVYMQTQPDVAKCAAKSLVAAIREEKRRRAEHEQIRARLGDESVPPLPPSTYDASMREVVDDLDRRLSEGGARRGLVKEAWEEIKQRGEHRHWSGLEREQLIKDLGDPAKDVRVAQLVSLNRVFAGEAHPSPLWLRTQVEIRRDGTHGFPDPALPDAAESARVEAVVTGILSWIRQLVEAGGTPKGAPAC